MFIRERMAATGIPGAAYAVVDRAGIRHSATFGVDGAGADVTAATPFLWGSVAKPVTARLIASMVEAGELRLDAPVVTYLPSLRTRDRARSDRITVRQLLNQTSGLPTSTRHTDRTDPNRRPGDVLAAVVEAVTDRPFAEVLTERVLDPIGMHTTVTTAEQASASLPAGHRYVFGRPMSFDVPIDPAGFGMVLPMRAGIGLSQLFLRTPDIAALVFAILGLAALLMALRIAVAARRCTAGDIGPCGRGAVRPSLTEYRRR